MEPRAAAHARALRSNLSSSLAEFYVYSRNESDWIAHRGYREVVTCVADVACGYVEKLES